MFLESEGTVKYTSKTSQYSIIESCNSVLLQKIVTRVNEAKCFSILTDKHLIYQELNKFLSVSDSLVLSFYNL